jgi:hypothetical protein
MLTEKYENIGQIPTILSGTTIETIFVLQERKPG